MGNYGHSFAGTYGRPNSETLQAIRTMKSFSFKALGDGNRYYFRLPTFETIEGDHWVILFQTIDGEVITVKGNVPDDLFRYGWSGKEAEFIQENIMFVQVQTLRPGDFNLKFWDLRFYH